MNFEIGNSCRMNTRVPVEGSSFIELKEQQFKRKLKSICCAKCGAGGVSAVGSQW